MGIIPFPKSLVAGRSILKIIAPGRMISEGATALPDHGLMSMNTTELSLHLRCAA
jgi:hypothetical protein